MSASHRAFLTMNGPRVLRLSLPLFLPLIACVGERADRDTVDVVSAVTTNQTLSQLHLDLPNGTTPGRFVVAAAGSLKIDDRALLRDSMGQSADASNTGTTITQVGVSGKVGDLFSQASVDLRGNAIVDGSLTTAGGLSQQPGSVIKGAVKTGTPITPLAVSSWSPVVPSGTGSNLTLQPNQTQTINPGAYAQVTVNAGAVLHLRPGTYKLAGLDLESGAKLVLDSVAQPTSIYVTGTLIYRGLILDAKNANDNDLPLLMVVLGTNAVQIDPVFRGTLFVPNASLSVGPGTHYASFFARDVELRPDTIVELRRFQWTKVLPQTKVSWTDAPVVLTASRNYTTGVDTPAQKTVSPAVTFTIPDYIYVRTGNSGNGQVEFTFVTPTSTKVTCTYHGEARLPHPVTDLERMRGRRYRITGCDNGYQLGQTATGRTFTLRVVSGDAEDLSGKTSVALHLGGGCSDVLPAPLAAEEVVAIRDNFSWDTIAKLNETDVQGHPALFHGMIYVENKAQLAALDRLRVFWSPQPISERYMSGLRGKCGRVEHATDGRGVVVYAVFPARLFNVMRDFAIQAKHGNVAPPFKFILPSPPQQPGFVNSDGSLSYAALGSSQYLEWLQTHPGQAGWFDDAVDFVSDTATDAWNWTKDKIVDPAVHYGEYGFDYVVNGFDFAIDFTANFLDNSWEAIQQGLQEFVLVFSDKINVHLQITMLNRDPLFVPGSTMVRAWGPADASGNRPNLVPAAANVRVRQWGWGFLPVMDQAELGDNGQVTLEAVKGASGRGGDLCIEMDTDYGMMTSDFIPNEVCDFAQGRYGDYQDDINDVLSINEPDLFAFTQVKDSSDYFKTVIGTDSYTYDILTGWIANEMTSTFNKGKHNPLTLCLDFPSLSASTITSAAIGLGAAGLLGGPVVAGIVTTVGLFGASLIEKDVWWPDADDSDDTRSSRGVMTHEYGHFSMCSLLFAENGPPGLTGLINRIFEGQADSRDDEIAQMCEGWADTFAMQVVGGSNYVVTPNATSGMMGFCEGSPCMDINFVGGGDASGNPFTDELARFETLFYDAFDRTDSTTRFTNAVANGDYWRANAQSGLLELSPIPYLANQDEKVSLPGPAWRTWAKHWLQHGLTPDHNDVMHGLIDTMGDQGFKWCDVCDLLALHDKNTPLTAFPISIRPASRRRPSSNGYSMGYVRQQERGHQELARSAARTRAQHECELQPVPAAQFRERGRRVPGLSRRIDRPRQRVYRLRSRRSCSHGRAVQDHRRMNAPRKPARQTKPSPARTVSLLPLLLLAALGPSACTADCKPPGYSEGERFQLTVLSRATGACTVAPLAVGDSFILTGGAARRDPDLCTVRGASPEVPSFATSVLTSCEESLKELGLDCIGMIGASCQVSADLQVGPHIAPGVTTIDDGVFEIVWTGSACNPGGCIETYNVRIDRLP